MSVNGLLSIDYKSFCWKEFVYTSHRIWYSEDLRLAETEERQIWIFAAEFSIVSLEQ